MLTFRFADFHIRLVTLQAVIRDTEHSLSNSVREVQSYVLQSAPSIAVSAFLYVAPGNRASHEVLLLGTRSI